MSALPTNNFVNNNCMNRIKPSLLRDVKTEALLVFSRTALERYFAKADYLNIQDDIEANEDTRYVYSTLRKLLVQLQASVVNVDYLISIAQNAHKHPMFKVLNKQEEPLTQYYNAMADKVRSHYQDAPASLPEFLIICVLAEWILGEEKSTNMYPFLEDFDFLELMARFEKNREYFQEDNVCKISDIHALSFKVTQKLKNYKYKVNKNRVSKKR